jgi:hypothetical protein
VTLEELYQRVEVEMKEFRATKRKAALSSFLTTAQYGMEDITLGLGSKVGRIQAWMRKVMFSKDIHFMREMKEKITPQIGQLLWLVVALCVRIQLPLDEALAAGDALYQEKHPTGQEDKEDG